MTKRFVGLIWVCAALSSLLSFSAIASLPSAPVMPFCDAECQTSVGSVCVADRFGRGAKAPDYVSALRSCEIEAEAGSANAQSLLAELHFLGLGTPQNFLAAAHWYRAAAGQLHPHAQKMLQEMSRLNLIPAHHAVAAR